MNFDQLPTLTALLLAVGGIIGSITTYFRVQKANQAEARRTALAQRLEERAADLEAMQRSLTAREEDYGRLRAELADVRGILRTVQTQADEAEQARDECERQRRSLEWEVDRLKRRIGTLEKDVHPNE